MAKNRSRVKVNDLGFAAIVAELSKIDGVFVTVGVQGDQGPRRDGTDMVLVASANEFGTADGRIPPRSFIRSTIDEQRQQIADVHEKALGKVADGKLTAVQAGEIAGMFVEAKIKKKITDLKVPANEPSTIAKKGSSNPLIDTAQLRSAITHKVIVGRAPPKGQV